MSQPFVINEADLSGEFSKLPGEVAWAAEQAAKRNRDFLLAKHEEDQVRANTELRIREVAKTSGAKTTEATISAMLELDEACAEVRLQRIEAEAAYYTARGVMSAVLAKKDMLVSLGAHQRAELDSHRTVINHKPARDGDF